MRIRRYASVLCLSLAISCASGFQVSVVAAQAEQTSATGLVDGLYGKLGDLIREYYKKAKITKDGSKIKIDYKSRTFTGVGNKEEIAPDFGGVMCDIELKPGPYSGKVRLPQQYNEHNFYAVILMAPYSKALNAHLYTKLLYPSDTPQEFLDRFKDLLNEYNDPVDESAEGPPSESSSSSESGATSASSSKPPAAPEVPKTKQLFWKAQRGNDVAYIVGTIPFRQTSGKALSMANEMKDAYKNSKSVIVDTIDLRTSLPYSEKGVRYSSGDKLSKHLSPASLEAMNSYLKWSGETMDMYDFWKPWFAAVAFENSSYRLNGFERVDWEKYIADRAKKDAKPIQEVESAEGKIQLFEGLPSDVQDKLLTLSIKELIGFDSTQKEMEQAWRAGDPDKLDQVATAEINANLDLKASFKKLKDERTNQMSKKIDEVLKNDSPVFVAEDAKNLVGDNGLIKRLTEKGFTIEQIACAPGSAVTKTADSAEAPTANFGGARLSRYTYPEGKFSVLLPGKPAMRYTTKTGMRQVEYIYQDTQGAYCVGYIILPGVPVASAIPEAFDATAKGLTTSYKALESKEAQAWLQGYPGRIINITKIKDKGDWGVHVRMFVIGNFLYILAAEGTTAWLKSPIVNEVSNSLTVTTPADEARARLMNSPWRGSSASPGPSTSIPRPSSSTGNPTYSNPRGGNGTQWGADQHGPTSPYNRNKNQWGGNNY